MACRLSDIKPSPKACRLLRFYKIHPEVMELYLRQGRIVAVIPVEKLLKRDGFSKNIRRTGRLPGKSLERDLTCFL
ncbi:MAG: hypothetical protein QW470_07760 [Candidatus Caldarchaeum sp.]